MKANSYKGRELTPVNVSSEPPDKYKLSEQELQYYHDNGFLIIRGLIDLTSLNNCREHFVHICNFLQTNGHMIIVKDKSLVTKSEKKEEYINKVNDIHFDEVFKTYTEHPALLDVAAQLIGDKMLVINAMFINKPPGSSEHHPHQDLHYTPYRPIDKLLGTWTAVDEATVDNGCLWVMPGSHKVNKLYQHEYLPGAMKMYHGIADQSVSSADKRMHLKMDPGDTLIFHILLIHGSGANTSKNYRKSISSHYVSSDGELIDVRGTEQDGIAKEMEREALRRGLELDFRTIWRNKSKEVKRKPISK